MQRDKIKIICRITVISKENYYASFVIKVFSIFM